MLQKKTIDSIKVAFEPDANIFKKIKAGIDLGFKLRKQAREKRDKTFLYVTIFVLIKEILDIVVATINVVPGGIVFTIIYKVTTSIITTIALGIFFWGRGLGMKKIFVKVVLLVITFFIEAIPGISVLPSQTIAVLWVWHSEKKDYEKRNKEDIVKAIGILEQVKRDLGSIDLIESRKILEEVSQMSKI